MRTYKCKNEIDEPFLKKTMADIFGNLSSENENFVSSLPPLTKITVKITGKKEISVETITSGSGDASHAIKVFNKFLDDITGYNFKERKKMAMK